MKYRYFGVILAVAAAIMTMTGCASSNSPQPDELTRSSSPASPNEQEYHQESTRDLTQRDYFSLPNEFRITYEMENGDGTLSLITLSKNGDGELHYQNASEEKWFLAQGNGYIQAQPDEGGKLVPISAGTILKDTAFQDQTLDFWNCAEASEKRFAPGFEWERTEIIAGRTCDLYTNYLGIDNMNVTYLLYVDQETGICLGWMEDAETWIFDTQPAKGTFLCSEFSTDSEF